MNQSPVTDADRRLARLQDHDLAKIERLGIAAAARIGFHARQAAIKAWRNHHNPGKAAAKKLHDAVPLITDCMAAGHLAGMRRSRLLVPKKKLSLATYRIGSFGVDPDEQSPFFGSIRFLADRLEMEDDDYERLQNAYHPEALKVVKTASDMVERQIEEKLQEAISSGQHIKGGIAALQEAFDDAGIEPRNSFTLEAIFRTQTALAYGAGRWRADQDPDIQERLWGYRYVTMEDDRVRPEHVGFDGVTLPKNDMFWMEAWPPNGWGCRCCAISIFEKRSLFHPRAVEVDGKIVEPSVAKGFRFNPGVLFG